jgi:hypothetical protein
VSRATGAGAAVYGVFHPAEDRSAHVSTRYASDSNRFRFWLLSALAVAGIGIAAWLIFLLIVHTVYAWGFLGAFLFIALVFLLYGAIYDRRHAQRRTDDY